MPIDVTCAGCGKTLRVADEHAGKRARCPECQQEFTVPDAAASKSPAASLDKWHVRHQDGSEYGPVDKSELDRWAAEGRVTAQSQLRRESETMWRPAGNVYASLGGGIAETSSANPFSDQAGKGGANPYASPAGTYAPPAQPGVGGFVKPHRGVTILVMALCSFICNPCLALSIGAWVMANNDLKEIRAGRMDQSGHGLTVAGMVIAIISTILGVIVVLLNLVMIAADA